MSNFNDFLVLSDEQYLELAMAFKEKLNKKEIIKNIKEELNSCLFSIRCFEEKEFKGYIKDYLNISTSFSTLYPTTISSYKIFGNIFKVLKLNFDIMENLERLTNLETKNYNLKVIKKIKEELFFLTKAIIEDFSNKNFNYSNN